MTHRRAAIAAGSLGLAALAVRVGAPLCPFALVTGIPCPGCGLGRATLALLGGHPLEALHFHPLVFVALPAIAAFGAHASGVRSFGERRVSWAAAALLAAMIVIWVSRFAGAFGGPVSV